MKISCLQPGLEQPAQSMQFWKNRLPMSLLLLLGI